MRSRVLAACVFAAVAFGTACSAVLGFESLSPLPDEAGAPNDGSSTVGDGSSTTPGSDGSTADAAPPQCVADFTKDAKNCGRCDHDCLGASCTNGVCEPIQLANGLAIPQGLTVVGARVYVAEYDLSRIVRFDNDKLGPCVGPPLPTECVVADQPNVFRPTAMGNDGDRIYWANTGGSSTAKIRACPLGGCGAQAAEVIAALGDDPFDHLFSPGLMPLELVIRDGLVFWPEAATGAIRSAQTDGGSPKTYFENASYMPLAVAVDDTEIYFTDETNQHQAQIAAVRRDGSSKDGGGVRVVATTPARPYGLGLTGGNLYWTIPSITQSDGLVQAAPTTFDGGEAIGALASAQLDPYMLIVDATNVYWVIPGSGNAATGMIVTCPLTGCPKNGPTILAKNQRKPRHLAQDGSAIYWSNAGLDTSALYDGEVWKIAKP